MRDKNPPLYLLTGIIIGVLAGLLIAYVLLPVRYADTAPATLNTDQKNIYQALVGRAYLYEADSGRAFSRLALLQEPDLNSALVAQSQQMVAAGGDVESARGLSLLAAVNSHPEQVITPLVQNTFSPEVTSTMLATTTLLASATATATPISATETPSQATATLFATLTPRPSATPKPTQGAPYQLVGQPKEICDPAGVSGQLRIYVKGTNGDGIPGVKIAISLPNGGSSNFYTGLYPEINNGYADFTMSPESTYTIRVGIGGDPINNLAIPQCTGGDGKSYQGSLEITLKQQ
jgi:hypothetical protein